MPHPHPHISHCSWLLLYFLASGCTAVGYGGRAPDSDAGSAPEDASLGDSSVVGVSDSSGPVEEDLCPQDEAKLDPGVCGCGVSDTDADGDGTLDCQDLCPGDSGKSTPEKCGCHVQDVDADGNGELDCLQDCPLGSPKARPGQCGCDTLDDDVDGDGVANCNDGCPSDGDKLLPGDCGCGTPDVDTDGDGVPNCSDGCAEDSGKLRPGLCGCGVADSDSDGDGTPDCNDGCIEDGEKSEPGSCGCGVPETDTDGDGFLDCDDACVADASKVDPGVCGCGVADTDTDGDGVEDCKDSDPSDPRVCRDDDTDGCDDCSSGTYNVGDDGPDLDGDGQCNVESLFVVPTYPAGGANWLDYVANDDPNRDIFHQNDGLGSQCLASNDATYLDNCLHGGEFRKVEATGAASCDGLVLTEELGLFDWACSQEAAGPVFYSSGLRPGKGIGAAIDYADSPLVFLRNGVTIEGPGYRKQSERVIWWSNHLRDVVADGPTQDTPNVLTRRGVNDLYIVKDDLRANGFNLNGNRIGLVVRPGKRLSYTGVANSTGAAEPSELGPAAVAVGVGTQSFTWIEGSYRFAPGSMGVVVMSGRMTRLNEVAVDGGGIDNQTDVNLRVFEDKSTHVSGYRAHGGFRCGEFASTYLSLHRLYGSGCRAGLMVWRGHTVFMQDVTIANTLLWEALQTRVRRVFVSGALVTGSGNHGLRLRSGQDTESVVTDYTSVGTKRASIEIIGNRRSTYKGALLVGSQRAGILASGVDNSRCVNCPSQDQTFVDVAIAMDGTPDVVYQDAVQLTTPWNFAYHGMLLTGGACQLAGVAPGVTSLCEATGPSTASAAHLLETVGLFVGAIGRDDAVNASDDASGQAQWALDMDHDVFENRYRAWSQDVGAAVPLRTTGWTGGTGAIWDYSLHASTDSRVFQRIPAFTHGEPCPAAVAGTETVVDARGDEFLRYATEIFFDRVGDDDGLCESNERCLYTPNVGAYQGHGGATLECVYNAAGGNVTGVTLLAHPHNGR